MFSKTEKRCCVFKGNCYICDTKTVAFNFYFKIKFFSTFQSHGYANETNKWSENVAKISP